MRGTRVVIVLFFVMLINSQDTYGQQLFDKTKPTVLYFHTDWCGYCAIQSKQIQKDSLLNSILKNQYNFIDFNAEYQEETMFRGKIYKPGKNNIHEFAKSFFPKNKQIAYPAWIILDNNHKILFRHEGLIKPKELKALLSTNWNKFSHK